MRRDRSVFPLFISRKKSGATSKAYDLFMLLTDNPNAKDSFFIDIDQYIWKRT